MNIKQHTLQSGESILLVQVPSDAIKMSIQENCLWLLFEGDNFKNPQFPYQDLPKGNWQLIGLSDEITEEMAKGLVDGKLIGKITYYYSYNLGYYRNLSALESFKSLMIHFECYDVNPYPEPTCDCKTEYDREGCDEECWQHINAESKVGRYAVLKEVKV